MESQRMMKFSGFIQMLAGFIVLSFVHYFAAAFLPVADCDETFNFVEPIHYLLYGSGLQTWENCPIYALRSWLFAFVYAAPGYLVTGMPSLRNVDVYFFIRIFYGRVACLSELFLVYSVWATFNGKAAMVTLLLLALNCPIPYAAVSALPTGFVMINYFMALGFWLRSGRTSSAVTLRKDPRKGRAEVSSMAINNKASGAVRTPRLAVFGAIFFVVLSCAVGWPFAGLLAVPMGLDLLIRFPLLSVLSLLLALLIIIPPTVALDTVYYCRPTWSGWNLVVYNLLGGAERGPALYGVEPWYYFVKNLLLNAHLLFLAGVMAPLVILLKPSPSPLPHSNGVSETTGKAAAALKGRSALPLSSASLRTREGSLPNTTAAAVESARASAWAPFRSSCGPSEVSRGRMLLYISPFFLWFAFWFTVPHKEERFMVPAYPFLVLAAAVSLTQVFFSTPSNMRGASAPETPPVVSPQADGGGRHVNTNSPSRRDRPSPFSTWILPFMGCVIILLFGAISFSRGMAIYHFYAGPQRLLYDTYDHVQRAAREGRNVPVKSNTPTHTHYTVCLGKEWYRFPSSFFLDPSRVRPAFLKTKSFSGALPLPFVKDMAAVPPTCRCGAAGVNDLNREIPAQYVRNASTDCDAVLESRVPSEGLDYPENVFAYPLAPVYHLLDIDRTPTWCRVLYYPFGITERCAVWRELELRGKVAFKDAQAKKKKKR